MKSYKTLLLTAAFGLVLTACGSSSSSASDEDSSSSTANSSAANSYAFAFMTDKSMMFGTGDFSDDQSEIIKNFTETSNSGTIAYFDGSLYSLSVVDEAMNSVLDRYELNEDGSVPEKPAASVKFEGTGAMMMKIVADENKIYVNQTFGTGLVAVDAKTLKTIATIDLSEYMEETAQMVGPGSSVVREGKLFVSLGQYVDAQNAITGAQGSVAIIDIATDKVEKVISESMTAAVGGLDDMNNSNAFVDEKGNIYFYSAAAMGWMEGYEEGWVRIKTGETEFDTSWVFRMKEAEYEGESSSNNFLMTGGAYAGDGKFVGFFGNFADPSNFYNYEWSFVVVDVYKKTVEKIPGLSPTIPWFAPSIHIDSDGSVLFGHADEENNSIYRYDVDSKKLTKEMDVKTGTAYYVMPLAD
jgi:sugar lactone lactonase YvrE